jgi:hypothetical protein
MRCTIGVVGKNGLVSWILYQSSKIGRVPSFLLIKIVLLGLILEQAPSWNRFSNSH